MTSASPSGVRVLPGCLGNKGELPPFWPPAEQGPRPRAGGRLPAGPEKLWNVKLSLQPRGPGVDRQEDFLPNSFISSLGHYVTLVQSATMTRLSSPRK